MAYQALYRRWRPINFDDMVGQEHITRTLQNQIVSGRTSHAYIFTGIRGTGKTSTAKVFSRAINCTNPKDGNPCNECPTCKGILDGSIFDVSEIDAASNNGVDNIREIREEVVYSATQTKYKVYIIDEVHMLSTGAFNALLKTLEEPPEHVVFILATTDIHKVPSTILSRCQRFDFRRITSADVAKHLKKVVNADGIEIDEEGLNLVSRLAEGSMRDGLSILDRLLAYGNESLTYRDIVNILGVAEEKQSLELLQAANSGNTPLTISILDNMFQTGKSVEIIINGLLSAARNIMMCRCLEKPEEIIDLGKESISEFSQVSKGFTEEKCVYFINTLSQASAGIRLSPNPRVSLEMAMVKLCNPAYMQSAEALADRLSSLEEKLSSGKLTPAPSEVVPPSPAEKKEKVKTVKIKPTGSFAECWKNVGEYLKENKSALYSILTQFEAGGEDDVLVLLYMTDDAAGCEKIIKDRETELFDAVEASGLKRPRKVVLQKKVVENATADKLEELAKLKLTII